MVGNLSSLTQSSTHPRVQGKRKKSSRKPQGPKKVSRIYEAYITTPRDGTDSSQKEPLPTTFACLFCNHEASVTVKMDRKAGTGELSCKVCGQKFQTGINCKFTWKSCTGVLAWVCS
jgi:transcription elongation factor Elf1